MPTPTQAILEAIRGILAEHNTLEEGPNGVYAQCERLVGDGLEALLACLHAVPAVPVAPHVDDARVQQHLAGLLRARGAPA